MNYYPQNNQYNPYNNIMAGTSNGVPASYPYQQQYPYMQTIGGAIPPIGYGYNGGYYKGSYGYNPYKYGVSWLLVLIISKLLFLSIVRLV